MAAQTGQTRLRSLRTAVSSGCHLAQLDDDVAFEINKDVEYFCIFFGTTKDDVHVIGSCHEKEFEAFVATIENATEKHVGLRFFATPAKHCLHIFLVGVHSALPEAASQVFVGLCSGSFEMLASAAVRRIHASAGTDGA